MDCDSIRAIEQCFCDAYDFDCRNCPISKYKISENLAVCYYGDDPYNSTEKQVNQFLAVARGHWKHEWDGRLNNSMNVKNIVAKNPDCILYFGDNTLYGAEKNHQRKSRNVSKRTCCAGV